MSTFQLRDSLYIALTPAGAYYAVSGEERNEHRIFLNKLLRQQATIALTAENLAHLTGREDYQELLYRCQQLGWLQGLTEPLSVPEGQLETILQELLPKLSANGRVLLADAHGFTIVSSGFDQSVVDELAALSADIAIVHQKYHRTLDETLKLGSNAWALVDAGGNSQVGFWPLYIGEHRFVLVLDGSTRLNQPTLTTLIWVLANRYGV